MTHDEHLVVLNLREALAKKGEDVDAMSDEQIVDRFLRKRGLGEYGKSPLDEYILLPDTRDVDYAACTRAMITNIAGAFGLTYEQVTADQANAAASHALAQFNEAVGGKARFDAGLVEVRDRLLAEAVEQGARVFGELSAKLEDPPVTGRSAPRKFKRFMVFGLYHGIGNNSGGLDDVAESFDTIEQAREWIAAQDGGYDNYEILDRETGEEVE